MRLGSGRTGRRRHRAFVPLSELGLSVWTVTCLRILAAATAREKGTW